MDKTSDPIYEMRYDKHTINHLGVQLYSTFPPVLGELISNAYDAEAHNVSIRLNYATKEIKIIDDGHGMSNEELREEFLIIGRNRRLDNKSGLSKNKLRKVTGKKGLGKLAMFGVAKKIEIISVCNNLKNGFVMDYDEMMNTKDNENYKPEPLFVNIPVEENNHTEIHMFELIKTITPFEDLPVVLAKRFSFFSEDFKTTLHRDDVVVNDEIEKDTYEKLLDIDLYYSNLDKQFEWRFPEDFVEEITENVRYKSLNDLGIKAYVVTTHTPLKKVDQGFTIYARGKYASGNTFFNDRSNDNFNQYVTGYFMLDFIDDDDKLDFISTPRQSVIWDDDGTIKKAKEDLDKFVSKIESSWRKKRAQAKEDEIETTIKESIPDLYMGLAKNEIESLNKIKKALSSNIDEGTTSVEITNILNTVKYQFQFDSFTEYVSKMTEEEITKENILKISEDWDYIESKELAKIASGRIETIQVFEKHIATDASETKIMQPFLEQFPWILDPRITSFEREVYFSNILKQQFPDDKLNEANRRIDFLCNTVGGELMIIELKRPGIKITYDEINQTNDYRAFILEMYPRFTKVVTYLISDKLQDLDRGVKDTIETFRESGKLFVKSYSELASFAKQYHKEFITKYKEIEEKKRALEQ